ncbi:MAG: FtsB family cell division protein [Ilumatobacteraceae bacterium]
MSSKTSSIPRAPARQGAAPRSGQGKKRGRKSALSDLTRPVPRSQRLIPRVIGRFVLVVGIGLVLVSFANSFVLLPAKSWLGQKDEITDRQNELEVIKRANEQLQSEIDQLQTPRGIEQAARSELGFVMEGEKRQVLVGSAVAPLDLPEGWPYDLVTRIMNVRTVEAQSDVSR